MTIYEIFYQVFLIKNPCVKAAVTQNGFALLYASDRLKKHPSILNFSKAAKVFTNIVLLCDDFLKEKESTNLKTSQFFSITKKLPMELQKIVANRLFDISTNTISSQEVSKAAIEIFKEDNDDFLGFL